MRPAPQLYPQTLLLAAGSEWNSPDGFWRFLHVSEGLGYLFDRAETLELAPGAMIVEPPQVATTLRSSQLNSLRVRWFLVDIDHLFGIFTLPERAWLRLGSDPDEPRKVFHWDAQDGLSTFFAQALSANRDEGGAITQRAGMLAVVAAFLTRMSPPPQAKRHPFLNSTERLEQLLGTLTESEFLALEVEDLAEHCRCDRRRVLQIFRQVFGASFRDHQSDLRKLRVSQMMDQGASLQEIVRECGYDSPESFRAWFRRAFGTGLNRWAEAHHAVEEGLQGQETPGGAAASI